MINNITTMDLRPQVTVNKTAPSVTSLSMPPILGFKTPVLKEKANIRVKKIRRADNIIVPGEIDDDYVDIVEEEIKTNYTPSQTTNIFMPPKLIAPSQKRRTKFLKHCYIIDFIQSPKQRCGLGSEAVKQLAEKAMFDSRAEGRIVTFSAPLMKESSPALFFYKLGFRFTDPQCNLVMEECLKNKMPDIPAQIGMMYLPKNQLHKLLRYGELF